MSLTIPSPSSVFNALLASDSALTEDTVSTISVQLRTKMTPYVVNAILVMSGETEPAGKLFSSVWTTTMMGLVKLARTGMS